nr:hypothetical protein [Tanacetum cinerariifolium]
VGRHVGVKLPLQVRAERLHARENYLTQLRVNGNARKKVEVAVGVAVVVGIHAVEAKHLNERRIRNAGAILQRNQVHARRVVLVNNLEVEVVAVELRGV